MRDQNPIKDQIDSELNGLAVDPALRRRILDETTDAPRAIRVVKGGRKAPRRILAAAVAVLLCLVLSVPVLGATVPEYNDFLGIYFPKLAALLMPASGNTTATADGIEVSLQSAVADTTAFYAMLTLTDTTGDRLSEDTLPDDLALDNYPFVIYYSTRYESRTKTLTLGIYCVGMDTFSQRDMTLTLRSLVNTRYSELVSDGEWNITFAPEMLETKTYAPDAVLPEMTIGAAILSPISLRLESSQKQQMFNQLDLLVTMNNGDLYYFSAGLGPNDYYGDVADRALNDPNDYSISTSYDKAQATIIFSFGFYIEPGDIASVSFNGVELNLG